MLMTFSPLKIPGPGSNFCIVKDLIRNYSSPPSQGVWVSAVCTNTAGRHQRCHDSGGFLTSIALRRVESEV